MNYLDYINNKLSAMSDSELKNFSEQRNFNVVTALGRGFKYAGKNLLGKSPKVKLGQSFKHGYRQERIFDRNLEKMWEGPAPFKEYVNGTKSVTNTAAKSAPKPITPPKAEAPKPIDSRIGTKLEPIKPEPKSMPVENTNAGKAMTAEAKSAENTAKEVAKTEEHAVANTAAREAEEVTSIGGQMTKFNSAAEAISANPKIQLFDKKIYQAVARGDTKMAAYWRSQRTAKAREIERAYHKAYSGKLRNAHEWARDHKVLAAPIGVAAGIGAAGVAGAGAAGVAGVVGLNKAADAVFD